MGNEEKKVAVKAIPKIKFIEADTVEKLEEDINEFLLTINDQKRLQGGIFAVNPKTGKYVYILNYMDIRPFTQEEVAEKEKFQESLKGSPDASNFGLN